jgi:uncharacterized protein YkwD
MQRRLWLPVLVGLVCLGAAALAWPGPAAATSGSGTRTAMTLTTAQFEARLLARANSRRDARGCHTLRLNSALVLAARRHTSLMVQRRVLSHQLSGESGLATRVERAGYTHWRRLGENLAWGQSSPRAVFRAWVRSPGHRAILDDCRLHEVGFAVSYLNGRPWVTADFGRRYG